MKNFNLVALAISVIFLLTVSCKKDSGMTRLEVLLTDSPGDYQEVNINVTGVEIHYTTDEKNNDGWKLLDTRSGFYNLLDYTNGLAALIATSELPFGKVSQIRLILGSGNNIRVNGHNVPLITPSAIQSGLKLNVHHEFVENITYRLLLDFDVAKSIVEGGAGQYLLKPVIRVITSPDDGAIRGVVVPSDAAPAIMAINGNDTITSAYTNYKGEFILQGLKKGTYSVVLIPKAPYAGNTISNIGVTIGKVTDMGTISLQVQGK